MGNRRVLVARPIEVRREATATAEIVGGDLRGADHLAMLQYSTYAVISPEGCASILWKSAEYAAQAAEAMGVTADRLKDLGLADNVVTEPLGGAHRNPEKMSESLKEVLAKGVAELSRLPLDELVSRRYERLTRYDTGR